MTRRTAGLGTAIIPGWHRTKVGWSRTTLTLSLSVSFLRGRQQSRNCGVLPHSRGTARTTARLARRGRPARGGMCCAGRMQRTARERKRFTWAPRALDGDRRSWGVTQWWNLKRDHRGTSDIPRPSLSRWLRRPLELRERVAREGPPMYLDPKLLRKQRGDGHRERPSSTVAPLPPRQRVSTARRQS